MTRNFSLFFMGCCSIATFCAGCGPISGPDKSLAGGVLGAGWGAGAGAVIGHQMNDLGPGAAIGTAYGAGAGLLTGIGYDVAEGNELEQERQLEAVRAELARNRGSLASLQATLDDRERRLAATAHSQQVYFDPGRASLKLGALAQLEAFAGGVKANPYIGKIAVHGHADDGVSPEENLKLSEARARSVANFLVNYGVSLSQISTYAHGASRPQAGDESEPLLNRRVEIIVSR